MVDGKADIENGNVPEDKTTEEKESELTSPFRLPGEQTSYCDFQNHQIHPEKKRM